MTTHPESPPPADAPTPDPPTMRRICCIAAPRRRAPSIADQLRAAAVWAQIFQATADPREPADQEIDESR